MLVSKTIKCGIVNPTKTKLRNYCKLCTSYISHRVRRFISIKTNKTLVKPFSCHILITNNCNLRCKMCSFWKIKSENELSLSEIKKIIDYVHEWGVPTITIGGGEPLLRKDAVDIIRYSSSKGIITNLITNGTLINESLAKSLMESNLFRIGVSIDGSKPEIHDKIRGVPGTFSRAVNGIKLLNKYKDLLGSDTIIYIQTTIMNDNVDDVPNIVELSRELGVRFLCQPYLPFMVNDDKGNEPDSKKIVKLMDYLIDFKKKHGIIINPIYHLKFIKKLYSGDFRYVKCTIGYDIITIDAKGDVWLCQYYELSDKPIGNVRSCELKEIWKSDRFEMFRRHALKCRMRCALNCTLISSKLERFAYDELALPVIRNLKRWFP